MATHVETHIPLKEASRKYGVPVEALTRLVQDGIIKLARTQEGDSVITVSTVDNGTAARIILEEIRPEQYEHLKGKPIRVTEAAQRYGISQTTMSTWADKGLVQIIDRRRRLLLLDEADIKLAADIFKRARDKTGSFVRAGWVLKYALEKFQTSN